MGSTTVLEHCLQQAARQAVGHHSLKEVMSMPIALTWHVFGFTITLTIKKKSNYRHSAK